MDFFRLEGGTEETLLVRVVETGKGDDPVFTAAVDLRKEEVPAVPVVDPENPLPGIESPGGDVPDPDGVALIRGNVKDAVNGRAVEGALMVLGESELDMQAHVRGWMEGSAYAGPVEVEIFSQDNWWPRPVAETLAVCAERLQTVV